MTKHFTKDELKWTYRRLRDKGLSHQKAYDEIQGMIKMTEEAHEKKNEK